MVEVVIQALKNLKKEGVRTFLTLIGIVIGVMAIVSLLSIGTGINITFENQFESIGTNTVFAAPGDAFNMQSSSSVKITSKDLDAIRQIRNVTEVIGEYGTPVSLDFENQKKNLLLFSIDDEGFDFYKESDFVELVSGRWVEKREKSSIMIPKSMADDTFGKEIGLRKNLKINGETYQVVGVFEFSTAFASMGGISSIVLTTLDGFKRINPEPDIIEMLIKTRSTDDVDQVKDDVTEYFEKKYGKKSITVLTSEQTIEQLGGILGVLTLVVSGIAGISLIIGGIGIMNAMFTSVVERTQEIGLLKALGATENTILSIFLLEAAFIGLIGGIIGLLLGFGLASLIAIVSTQSGLDLVAYTGIEIIIGALTFSILAGMISGAYPAYKASKLDPVEAIRNE